MEDKSEFIKRKSILEGIDFHIERNLFCAKKLLTNEASVENFFVNRLLQDLGYKDNNIKHKESIQNLTIAKGSKKFNYKPDYCIIVKNVPKLIIDAKSPHEDVYDWIEQCAHYSLLLNRKHKSVEYFMITNGIKTILNKWDEGEPIIELDFEDFYAGNEKYEKFRKLISLNGLVAKKIMEIDVELDKFIVMKKVNKETAQKLFLNCHNYIWSTEKRGPLSAFTEFTKLIFLKLWNDRILHDKFSTEGGQGLKVPQSANTFSVKWIESREKDLLNPINDISFKNLLEHIQDDIDKKKKKRIFSVNETIQLKPTTIKGVVSKLEKVDLYGIDEDLNGRLFETFLNSTMRGEALGQYFTPRSIVLLGTIIADLEANEKHIDKVLDGSCGTGWFLIEALSIMRNKIRNNESYSKQKKIELINKISNECIYGIDAAAEPNLARIARINMYLHGDGGSHIYFADGLLKTIEIDKNDNHELQLEIQDMQNNINPNGFDVVLTNPPFSMWYETKNETQAKVLSEYGMLKMRGTNKTRNRLRGSAMFIERYCGLLKGGGKLITIIDETVLSSPQYDYLRNFIRDNFIIRSIISLHGDAFQMAKARVKTALIYLEKKNNSSDEQPSAFMTSSIYLGVDDMPVTTNPDKVQKARELAKQEIGEIKELFDEYRAGKENECVVSPERLRDRLDVKYCIPSQGRFITKWKKRGYDVLPLYKVCDKREEIIIPNEHKDIEFKTLTITYSGRCKMEETRLGKNINYPKMKIVREGDLVFSEYNAFHGAIGYITEGYDGALASGSYTVVRCFNDYDSLYLWSILRSTEIRADFLTSAIGMGRQTIDWEDMKNVVVPLLPVNKRKIISREILRAWEAENEAKYTMKNITQELHEAFDVESEESKIRFESSKPPK